MPNILITGSNRGLGLEWVRQYAGLGWRVYATYRFPEHADDLKHLSRQHGNISIHQLDVTQDIHIRGICGELKETGLDILVNNAGVYFERWGKDKLGAIDYAAWLESFNVNTLGAVRMTEALRKNIARSEKRLAVAVTSHMGSIEDITTPNDYAYRSSKAALNAAMKGLVCELSRSGVGILLVHPGWVRTRMGGNEAPLSAEKSVRNMRMLVDNFTLKDSGRFFRHDGVIIPW